MNKVLKFVIAYGMWIVDLGLGLWLIFLSRTVVLDIFALFAKQGGWAYARRVDFADKAFVLILGIGWLVLMIFAESYFRNGAQEGDLLKRVAKVTGSILLAIFGVDLILFWLQGLGASNWLRWLILATEMGIGIALVLLARPQSNLKPT